MMIVEGAECWLKQFLPEIVTLHRTAQQHPNMNGVAERLTELKDTVDYNRMIRKKGSDLLATQHLSEAAVHDFVAWATSR